MTRLNLLWQEIETTWGALKKTADERNDMDETRNQLIKIDANNATVTDKDLYVKMHGSYFKRMAKLKIQGLEPFVYN